MDSQTPTPKPRPLANLLYTWLTRAVLLGLFLLFQGLVVYSLFLRYAQ